MPDQCQGMAGGQPERRHATDDIDGWTASSAASGGQENGVVDNSARRADDRPWTSPGRVRLGYDFGEE
jgi:hypothetical protein